MIVLLKDKIPPVVLTAGSGGSRGSKVPKRGSQASVVMSPGSHGVSNLYLADGKDRGSSPDLLLSPLCSPPPVFIVVFVECVYVCVCVRACMRFFVCCCFFFGGGGGISNSYGDCE